MVYESMTRQLPPLNVFRRMRMNNEMADLDALRQRYEKVPRGCDNHLKARLKALLSYPSKFWVWKVWPHPYISMAVGVLFTVAGIALINKPAGWKCLVGGLIALLWGICTYALVTYEYSRLVRRGELVYAWIFMANDDLFRAGGKRAPGIAIFSLDPEHRYDLEFLNTLADRVNELFNTPKPPGHGLNRAWAFVRSGYGKGCVKIPSSYAGSEECYLSGVILDPAVLPRKKKEDLVIPALADVGQRWVTVATLLAI